MTVPATTVQEIEVTIRDQSGFELVLAVPLDSRISDIIKAIQQEAPDRFPEVDRNGRLVRYAVENTRTGAYPDPNATIADADIQKGDVLEVHPKPIGMG